MGLSVEDVLGLKDIYSFVDAETGENVHISAVHLTRWLVETKHEVVYTPVQQALLQTFVDDNAISPSALERLIVHLARGYEVEPIVYCMTGTFTDGRPDVMLVDGRHRYALFALRRAPVIPSYLVERKDWEPFRIEGLKDLTAQELRMIPPKGRMA